MKICVATTLLLFLTGCAQISPKHLTVGMTSVSSNKTTYVRSFNYTVSLTWDL